VVPDLIAYGKVRRPTLGVTLAADHLARRLGVEGALVVRVYPGSGADRAGIQPTRKDWRGRLVLGDTIVGINAEPVRSSHDVRLSLEKRAVGETVAVTVVRGRQEQELEVVLGQGE
jgi:S1-C subfamily serine protease